MLLEFSKIATCRGRRYDGFMAIDQTKPQATGNATEPALKQEWLLPAILILGVAIRFIGIGRESLWFDELYNIWANKLPFGDMLREQIAAGHPPLYYLAVRAWYAFGTGEEWVRSFSAVAGIFTLVFVFLAGRDLFSRRIGLWAAAFAAVSPLLVWYSRANTFYAFMIALTALSFWLLIRASLQGGWGNWALYTIAASGVLFSYFYGAVLVGAGWLFFLLIGQRDRRAITPWLVSQAVLLGVTATTYIMSKSAITEAPSFRILSLGQLRFLLYDIIISPAVLIAGKADAAINYTGAQGFPVAHVMLFALAVLVLAAAAFFSKTIRDTLFNRKTVAIYCYVIPLVAGPMILQLIHGGTLSGRFYVWAAPAFLLLVAVIIAAMPRRIGFLAGVAALAALLVLSFWIVRDSSSGDSDWRSLMGTISEDQMDGDMLVSFPLHNGAIAADYYLPKAIPIAGGMPSLSEDAIYFLPPGNVWGGYISGYWAGSGATPPLAGAKLEDRFSADISGAKRLWVVTADDTFTRYPEVNNVLDAGWHKKQSWDYPPVTLILFDAKGSAANPAP